MNRNIARKAALACCSRSYGANTSDPLRCLRASGRTSRRNPVFGRVKRIEELGQGVQVRLVNRGFSDPSFWNRVDGLARRMPGEPHPFVAPEVFLPWIQQLKAEMTSTSEAGAGR